MGNVEQSDMDADDERVERILAAEARAWRAYQHAIETGHPDPASVYRNTR